MNVSHFFLHAFRDDRYKLVPIYVTSPWQGRRESNGELFDSQIFIRPKLYKKVFIPLCISVPIPLFPAAALKSVSERNKTLEHVLSQWMLHWFRKAILDGQGFLAGKGDLLKLEFASQVGYNWRPSYPHRHQLREVNDLKLDNHRGHGETLKRVFTCPHNSHRQCNYQCLHPTGFFVKFTRRYLEVVHVLLSRRGMFHPSAAWLRKIARWMVSGRYEVSSALG